MSKHKLQIDSEHLQIASEIMRALAHPLRLKILAFIDQNGGVVLIDKIYNTLRLEHSITSQHLKILKLAQILEVQAGNQQIKYQLNYRKLETISKGFTDFLQHE